MVTRKHTVASVFGCLGLLVSGCGDSTTAADQATTANTAQNVAQGRIVHDASERFVQYVVDTSPNKPAFIHVADLNDDGVSELIVSIFGNSGPLGEGYVNIYSMKKAGDIEGWRRQRLPQSNAKFPNNLSTHDIDGDGDLDIVVPSGFLACAPGSCGSLAWFENANGEWRKHTLVRDQTLFYHSVQHVDLNGDGFKDLVTVGESKPIFGGSERAEVHAFPGIDSEDIFAKRPVRLARGLGSMPSVLDIDADGDLDIASAEYFASKGSFAWLENLGANQWAKHYIDATRGKSIQLSFIDNLFGDGALIAVGANHTNTNDRSSDHESAVFAYRVPKDNPTQPWPGQQISEGMVSRRSPWLGPQGAPGIFAYGDVDGDNDIDIIVHGDGDPHVYWLEQLPGGEFATHTIVGDFAQGGVAVYDLDGDGIDEIVASSYENNKLSIFDFIAR